MYDPRKFMYESRIEDTTHDHSTWRGPVSAVSFVLGKSGFIWQRMKFSPQPKIGLRINGVSCEAQVDARNTLLDLLREHLQLTGTKKGCNFGECGVCTVHLNGRRVNACLVLAAAADGSDVTTIEGLAENGKLHPVQQAFIDQDAFQCGYCTPGQVMSAVALIREGHANTPAEIREWMSGNICRCSSYPQIVAAVEAVVAQEKGN